MVKLVDTYVSGAYEGNLMRVQVSPAAFVQEISGETGTHVSALVFLNKILWKRVPYCSNLDPGKTSAVLVSLMFYLGRAVQGRVGAIPCGFESHLRHQLSL